MPSGTTAWTAGDAPASRLRRRLTVVAITIAIVVTGGAILAAVDTLTWSTSITASPAATEPSSATSVSATADDGTRPPADRVPDDSTAEADGERPDVPADDVAREGADAPVGDDSSVGDEDGAGEDGAGEEAVASERDAGGGGDSEAGDDHAASGGDGNGGEDEGSGDTERDERPDLSAAEIQEKLREYRFLIGPADGEVGQQTTAAVMAFQRVNGLAVDGVVGPETSAALQAGSAEPDLAGGEANRIEIDLDRQLLHLIEGGQLVVTLHSSSGDGEPYETTSGGTARAVTPVGGFTVERRIHGVRNAPLGTLHDPLYFHHGFAIHGSPSVPAHAASHGCVRVTIADAAWLIQRVPDGMPVHVYGGTHVFTP